MSSSNSIWKAPAGLALLLALAAFRPGPACAQVSQQFVLDKPSFTYTLPMAWDSVDVPNAQEIPADLSVLSKVGGLGGLAYVQCAPGSVAPDLDVLTADLAGLLGGNIAKGESGSLTLGPYAVGWQEFTYDSLPLLNEVIRQVEPSLPALKDGKFRVYWLVSSGYVFTVAGLPLISFMETPYKDIEGGIAKLVLKPNAGTVRHALRRAGPGLRVSDGILRGDWLDAHPAVSVVCHSLDGAFAGHASRVEAGAWKLPSGKGALAVHVRSGDGQSLRILARP